MKKQTTNERQLVWSVEWDSGGPGAGAGDEEVYLKGGKYFYEDSDSGYRCRASDLRSLLRSTGLNRVSEATVSISSPVFSAEEIVAMLDVRIGKGSSILLNDEEWVCKAKGVLIREEEEPPTQDDPAQQRLPFEDDEEFEGEESVFSCPFCGSVNDDCPHFLDSRDLNFCGDFTVDDAGPLANLGELFVELGAAVQALQQGGGKESRIAALEPRRLRILVQRFFDGDDNLGFTDYVTQLMKDTKVPARANSYEEDGSPGFCSTVMMFWSEKPSAALAEMRSRLIRDIALLRGQCEL